MTGAETMKFGFTLHSATIKTIPPSRLQSININLHYTLLLLKHTATSKSVELSMSFTLHSATIKTNHAKPVDRRKAHLHYTLLLLKLKIKIYRLQ